MKNLFGEFDLMRVFLFSFVLSCLSATALAQQVQFKAGSISIGDSVDKLLKVAGKPDQVRPFPGAPAFTVYEYSLGSRQVNVSTKNGKITGIADNTVVSKPSPARASGVELNGSTVAMGDSLAKLLKVAGKPSRVRTFAGSPGLSVYEYSLQGREVSVTVQNGKVTGTSEMKVVRR